MIYVIWEGLAVHCYSTVVDGSFLQRLNSGGDLEVNTTSLQYLTSPPGDRKLVR